MIAPRPATIRILLADGTPEGLRVIEKSNWTGRGFDFKRADWSRVRERPDFAKPGVYVLLGIAEDGGDIVYIGETDELRSRLNLHHGRLDFWTRAIVFTSKDENLNKAGVKYLEARLHALAATAKRVEVQSGNVPGLPFLSEADQAEAQGFLEEMLPIYPLLGLHAFEVVQPRPRDRPRLRLARGALRAFGRDTADGFIVESGSTVRAAETKALHSYVRALRRKLQESGTLELNGESLRFSTDWISSSPSTAAMVILGRPANGRTEWVDDEGRTLKVLQEMAVE